MRLEVNLKWRAETEILKGSFVVGLNFARSRKHKQENLPKMQMFRVTLDMAVDSHVHMAGFLCWSDVTAHRLTTRFPRGIVFIELLKL